MAEKLKIEPRQLSKLETGKHYPSFETIVALLETFDISFEELISFEHLNSAQDVRKLLLKDIENTIGFSIPEMEIEFAQGVMSTLELPKKKYNKKINARTKNIEEQKKRYRR